MKQHKYGPPAVKARTYSVMLELLETQANNKLTGEYQSEVVQAMAAFESKTGINPPMIDLQPEIQWFMRPFLLDFLVELHTSFKLQPQTLFLCLNIIDRYCSKRIVFKRHYQLVGCTALWIAGKYEDKKSRVPTLKDLTLMCRNAYDEEMFVQMEMHILSTLDWNLVHPNMEDCLQLAIQTSNVVSSSTTPIKYNKGGDNALSAVSVIGRFLCEVSLYERYFLTVPTSIVAITANLLACSMLQIPHASESLRSLFKTAVKKKSHLKRSIKRKRSMYSPSAAYYSDGTDMEYESCSSTSDGEDDQEPNDTVNTTVDDFVDENHPPEIFGAFLSGFDERAMQQIKKTALMLIIQLSKVTEVLSRKYESLGAIQVINNFHQRFKFVISTIYENQAAIAKDDLDSAMSQLAELLLQLPDEDFESTKRVDCTAEDSDSEYSSGNEFRNSEAEHGVPTTPPSASSQYSIFSNRRASSVCNTPVYASRSKSRIYKHRNNHASTTSFDSHISLSVNVPYQGSSCSLNLPAPQVPYGKGGYNSGE